MSYKQFTDEQILDSLLKIRNYCEHTDDCRDCPLHNPHKGKLCIFELFPIPELIDDHTLDLIYAREHTKTVKLYTDVKIKYKDSMSPSSIDEIGRYHFNLDIDRNDDIVFNSDMEKLSGLTGKIINIHPYSTKSGKVSCTFQLENKEYPEMSNYTFSLDMIDFI